jgi:DNA-binding XRE family transcriptional regulator
MKEKPGPNKRLRSERERRGWTRNYVADKIGSDTRTVGRWERGTTSPHVYPTNFGDPAIDHVNFTVTWPGSHWQVACIAYPPTAGDIFRCDVNLIQLGTPHGQVTVSFDVYDQAGNVNFAPNGVHMIMYYAV